MRDKIAFGSSQIGMLPLILPINHRPRYDEVTSMHQKEHSPNQIKNIHHQNRSQHRWQLIVLKRHLFSQHHRSTHTVESHIQKYPKTDKQHQKSDQHKRKNQHCVVVLHELVRVVYKLNCSPNLRSKTAEDAQNYSGQNETQHRHQNSNYLVLLQQKSLVRIISGNSHIHPKTNEKHNSNTIEHIHHIPSCQPYQHQRYQNHHNDNRYHQKKQAPILHHPRKHLLPIVTTNSICYPLTNTQIVRQTYWSTNYITY